MQTRIPALSLGPVYFLWDGPKWRDFYFRIADEASSNTITRGSSPMHSGARIESMTLCTQSCIACASSRGMSPSSAAVVPPAAAIASAAI